MTESEETFEIFASTHFPPCCSHSVHFASRSIGWLAHLLAPLVRISGPRGSRGSIVSGSLLRELLSMKILRSLATFSCTELHSLLGNCSSFFPEVLRPKSQYPCPHREPISIHLELHFNFVPASVYPSVLSACFNQIQFLNNIAPTQKRASNIVIPVFFICFTVGFHQVVG